MLPRIVIVGLLALASGNVFAQTIQAELSNSSARFNYATSVWGKQYGRAEVGGGLLYNDDSNYAVNADLHVYNDSYESPLELGVGGRIYYVDVGPYNVLALALGLRFNYAPQALHGFGIGAHYYYAPKVVTGLDGDHMSEYGIYLGYQMIPQANVYVGYRKVKTDIKNGPNLTMDKGGYVGVRIRF
ncbi:MAG TPA: YfaZ family outer membrane protein [Gammaproteobacteria bacterium]|nr:YfaZ family outer membrane protein [Gammaproteobacteria bacterium]